MSFLLAACLIFSSCGPDIPITKEEVTDLREKLDICVNNLDDVEAILTELMEELQKYLDINGEG